MTAVHHRLLLCGALFGVVAEASWSYPVYGYLQAVACQTDGEQGPCVIPAGPNRTVGAAALPALGLVKSERVNVSWVVLAAEYDGDHPDMATDPDSFLQISPDLNCTESMEGRQRFLPAEQLSAGEDHTGTLQFAAPYQTGTFYLHWFERTVCSSTRACAGIDAETPDLVRIDWTLDGTVTSNPTFQVDGLNVQNPVRRSTTRNSPQWG